MSLKDLPAQARPREKLMARGPAALSDAELLALLLRTGIAGKGVLQMADELLQIQGRRTQDGSGGRGGSGGFGGFGGFGGIAGLLSATPDDLKKVKGLGPAKRAEILAVLELARRAIHQRLSESTVLADPSAVKQHLQLRLAHLKHEVFVVCFLDAQNKLLQTEELFRGTLSQTSVYPREVVLRALHHHAAAVLLAHNHPSGSVQPSQADIALTQTLRAALALIDVRVLDHIVVGAGEALSMAERGLM
jgi:DNA repair protein RadC